MQHPRAFARLFSSANAGPPVGGNAQGVANRCCTNTKQGTGLRATGSQKRKRNRGETRVNASLGFAFRVVGFEKRIES